MATETSRAYGVLATSFNEALGEARSALAAHAALMPADVLPQVDALLDEFRRRRVRIAVFGEVKAGKSTLVNAIAGAALSPTAFDPLTSVPIRLTYGAATAWHADGRGFTSAAELADAMRQGMPVAEVVVTTPLDLLQLGGQVDLVDTPGVGSEERLDVVTEDVLRTLDAVVLVVRYPALFTQFTRTLVERLEADLSKLFVVWNLDGSCTELDAAERDRQREGLRANVAGAHELLLVDAKRGFEATQSGSAEGREDTGLSGLTRALAGFAGSEKRDAAALRESAKRCRDLLDGVTAPLAARRQILEQGLTATRARFAAILQQADARRGQEHATFAALQAGVNTAAEQRAAAARRCAGNFRQKLRTARRRWVSNADAEALQQAVATAAAEYADAIVAVGAEVIQTLRAVADGFETEAGLEVRERVVPLVEGLCPSERAERARKGGLAYLRRALWRGWYLPGLTVLLTRAVDDDLSSQQEWFEDAARKLEAAAQATRDVRLAAIQHESDAAIDSIKQETGYDADLSECERLTEDIPTVIGARDRVGQISDEARKAL